MARERGFAHVSTTLVVSPYQLFDTCRDVLGRLAASWGLEMVWRDFRAWYPEATARSRELGMYRQSYCGCRFSAAEATIGRHEARDARKAARAAATHDARRSRPRRLHYNRLAQTVPGPSPTTFGVRRQDQGAHRVRTDDFDYQLPEA